MKSVYISLLALALSIGLGCCGSASRHVGGDMVIPPECGGGQCPVEPGLMVVPSAGEPAGGLEKFLMGGQGE